MPNDANNRTYLDTQTRSFLEESYREGMELAAASDKFELHPEPSPLPQKYIASFSCKGLVRADDGEIVTHDRFGVGIWFPDDYMIEEPNPFKVLTWLGPPNAFHSNIAGGAPYICIGDLSPGTELVSILYQLYEIITWQKYNLKSPLNNDACQWARNQPCDRFPVDRRPLKRARKPEPKPEKAGA